MHARLRHALPASGRRARVVALGLCATGLVPAPLAAQAPTAALPAAHELVIESWTIEDGLPLSHLTGVVFASDGYLWLSSFDGLIRFDGAKFTVFNTSTNPELPTNRFANLAEGPDGTLWAAAEFDYVVRIRRGAFDILPLPGAKGTSVGAIRFDPQGTPWVTTNRGIFTFHDDALAPLPGADRRGLGAALHWDRDGVSWISSGAAGALRRQDGALESVNPQGSVRDRSVQGFAEGADGTMYIGTGSGVLAYRSGEIERVPVSGTEPVDELFVRGLFQIAPDSVLVISDEGVFDLVEGRLVRRLRAATRTSVRPIVLETSDRTRWMTVEGDVYRGNQLVFDGDFAVLGLAEDHEGSVWIAADGLHRLKPRVFRTYGEPEGSVSNVYGLMEDSRGRIWLGSLKRTARHETGEFHILDDMPPLVQSFLEDSRGRVWIGRINYGACRVVEPGCPEEIPYLAGHTVKALYEDRAGSVWIGTDRGVYRDSAGTVTRFDTEDGLTHNFVRVIRQTRDGAVWFGTNGGGVARYAAGRIEVLTRAEGLPSDLVRAIHEDERGGVWIGTEDAGLAHVALPPTRGATPPPLSQSVVTTIDRADGLYDNGIHTILDDRRGRLWMSTNRGIFWVLKAELDDFVAGRVPRVHPVSYTERDGLRNREANGGVQAPAIMARDGRLWFATQAGVAVVDPANLRLSDADFPVRVEALRTRTGAPRTLPDSGHADPLVRLGRGDRDFEIDYTALSFLAPENLRFQYRLTGLQQEWIDAGNRRTAFFTNVPPGRYTFQVRATRGDGEWREAEAPMVVAVAPFFYETTPFRASILAALGFVGFLGLRVREQRHQRRAEALSALVAERTATVEAQAERLLQLDAAKSRFFANVSHEFRTPLTLTIGPLEDLESGLSGTIPPGATEQIRLSLRNARRLLRLVNQLLEIARLEAGAVRVQAAESDLVPYLRDVFQGFAPLAERQGITTEFAVPTEPLPAFIDAELMERVLVNLLSNAFKFTPEGGTIRLSARREPHGWLSLEVRDSGTGIPPDRLPHIFERFYQADASRESRRTGTGIGLSVARELVQLHGGRLEVESAPGFGSAFTIWLRSGAGHLAPDQLAERSARGRQGTPTSTAAPAGVGGASSRGAATADFDTIDTGAADEAADLDEADVPSVLVVEDNVEIVEYLRRHLTPRFRVLEARDGIEALERVRDLLPDVIVSDVMMPRMSGLELVQKLQADRELAYVPVLLLTARADQKDKLAALDLGAADYLTKPFDIDELESRIANLIETRRRLEQRLARQALLHPEPPAVQSSADRFLVRVRETVEANLSDEDFHVRELARALRESRSTLYRHLMEVCGRSPSDVIRSIRLERAAQLLAVGQASVGSVAYAVGFKSVSHFSRCFHEAYGVPPSAYSGDPGAASGSGDPGSRSEPSGDRPPPT